eukprot:8362303-Pyramimonas_sp.AAC.1
MKVDPGMAAFAYPDGPAPGDQWVAADPGIGLAAYPDGPAPGDQWDIQFSPAPQSSNAVYLTP